MSEEVQINSVTEDFIKSYFTKKLEYELIESIIYFLCMYPIFAVADYTITRNEKMIYFNFLMIIPILVMTYIRVKTKKMVTFLIGIIGTMIISSMIVVLLSHYVLLGLILIWGVLSIKKCNSMQRISIDKSKLLMLEGFFIPQIILGAYVGTKSMQIVSTILPIAVMFIAIGYMCKVRNLRLSRDDAKNFSFNNKDSNTFIAGLLIFMCIIITSLYYLGAFEIAHNYSKNIADHFVNMGTDVQKSQPPKSTNTQGGNKDDLKGLRELQQNGPFDGNSMFFQVFSKVINFLFNAMLVIAVSVIIFVIINRVLIYFKRLKNVDKITFIYNDKINEESELKQKLFNLKNSINKVIFLNNNDKIRKLYKNKIIKLKKSNVNINNYLSTSEIEKEILIKTQNDIKKITKIYEKARYSNDDITLNDLEVLKSKK